jgi:hypothetical protein
MLSVMTRADTSGTPAQMNNPDELCLSARPLLASDELPM